MIYRCMLVFTSKRDLRHGEGASVLKHLPNKLELTECRRYHSPYTHQINGFTGKEDSHWNHHTAHQCIPMTDH